MTTLSPKHGGRDDRRKLLSQIHGCAARLQDCPLPFQLPDFLLPSWDEYIMKFTSGRESLLRQRDAKSISSPAHKRMKSTAAVESACGNAVDCDADIEDKWRDRHLKLYAAAKMDWHADITHNAIYKRYSTSSSTSRMFFMSLTPREQSVICYHIEFMERQNILWETYPSCCDVSAVNL